MYIHTHTLTHTYIHTHTYTHFCYLDIKKKEMLTFVAIWVEPEGIMLREIESEKDKILLVEWKQSKTKTELIYTENRIGGCQKWGVSEMGEGG